MATAKTFETSFNIGAKFIGQPGFNKAFNALDKLGRKAVATTKAIHATTAAFGKKVAGITTGILGSVVALRAFAEATEFLRSGIIMAREEKKAFDDVVVALKAVPQIAKLGDAAIQKQAKAFKDLAESLEATGVDAEDTMAIFKKGIPVFTPKELEKMIKGFEGFAIKTYGVNASQEEFVGLMGMLNTAVRKNVAGPLVKLGLLTAADAKAFKDMNDDAAQAAFLIQKLEPYMNVTTEAMKTSEGQAKLLAIEWDNIKQRIGQPFVAAQDKFTASFRRLIKPLGEVADRIALRLEPILAKFADTLDKDGPLIIWMIDKISEALLWIIDHWKEIVVGIIAITAAIVAFKVITGVINIILGLVAAFTALWAIIGAAVAATPVGWLLLALAAIAAAAILVYLNWDKVKAGFIALVDVIKEYAPKLFHWLVDPWLWWYDKVVELIEKLWKKLKGFWDNIISLGGIVSPAKPHAVSPSAYTMGTSQARAAQAAAGYGTTSAGSGELGPTTPNAAIAAERARVIAQLNEPGMRELVAAVLAQEMGSAGGRADVLEALVNRAVVTGEHPRDLIRNGFYGPVKSGKVDAAVRAGMSKEALKQYDEMLASVAAGRNRILGRVDQGEVPRGNIGAITSEGEPYSFWKESDKNTVAYREGLKKQQQATQQTKMIKQPGVTHFPGLYNKQGVPLTPSQQNYKPIEPYSGQPGLQGPSSLVPKGSSLKDTIRGMNMRQRMEGASGGQNIAMNPTINVHGVAAGSENLIAQKIKTVVEDNSKQTIAQMKQARSYANRIGYV